MFGKDNSKIARQYYDAFNARDLEGALKLIHQDAEYVDHARGTTRRGHDAFREDYWGWLTPFPDGKAEITNILEGDDDWVIVEYTGRATHSGPLEGPSGQIPPTGRRVELRLCDLVQVKDGKIAKYRTYYDMATLMYQLGLLPSTLAA